MLFYRQKKAQQSWANNQGPRKKLGSLVVSAMLTRRIRQVSTAAY